jgi:hypothetical protein
MSARSVLTVAGGTATTRPARGRQLTIHVIATTIDGTRAALTEASRLARGLGVRVVLLVPHTVPYGESLEGPSRQPAHSEDCFRALADECSSDVSMYIVVCRPGVADLARLLPADATLLVGGAARRLWPTREERVAHTLAAKGHRVLFVELKGPNRP